MEWRVRRFMMVLTHPFVLTRGRDPNWFLATLHVRQKEGLYV